ncbi:MULTISPECIES: HlyU family transcriptional regulator [Photobacterium]|uniref:Transcriptional regulator n=1 Tax=Photobacterium ganghwense TaxID=320778 RepID=A0A0J1HER9_9GAMM|nr:MULTISPECIES: HlyU family transcriptional regulator [Photobacterium]KLV10101.1 transcriptional regulator [Photobacterium ganghwense]MBV1841114.1 transcriptional regulator [Photobacterium ganghwense]PSU05339.1 transcriptional regulator [Photobacterium ganghwense]QSV17283.1 transcriptional regulator [Photobacterium ganghwense]
MGFFSKLFGLEKSTPVKADVEPIEYKGYLIYPEPKSEGGQFRIAGRICKQFDDELKTHAFIRSDLLASKQDAETFMVNKAKMFIDQTGDSMFR